MSATIHLPQAPFRPVVASLNVNTIPVKPLKEPERPAPAQPFVTISRQAGAGAKILAEDLVNRLNMIENELPQRWTSWDRELVEKVASELGTRKDLVEGLTESDHNWLQQFFDDLSASYDFHHASEFRIYRRVASTIRALAQSGRVVIVGRGGVHITRDLPGGLHLRLVAPLEHRIQTMMKRLDTTYERAKEYVTTTDRAREKFDRQHFSGSLFSPDTFSITFNTSAVSAEQMVDAVVAALGVKQPVSA